MTYQWQGPRVLDIKEVDMSEHNIKSDVNIDGVITVSGTISGASLLGDGSNILNASPDASDYLQTTDTDISIFGFADPDADLTADSDILLPTQAAVKGYIDKYYLSGTTRGFVAGGVTAIETDTDSIETYPFSTNVLSTSHGTLSSERSGGSASSSETEGFIAGGQNLSGTPTLTAEISKTTFSTGGATADHGDVITSRLYTSGNSGVAHGYVAGGIITSTRQDIIEKFPYATASSSADHGDLSETKYYGCNQEDGTYCYHSSGTTASVWTNVVERWLESSNTTATDLLDLSVAKTGQPAGLSTSQKGYTMGGSQSSSVASNVCDYFVFATTATAVDFGDLSVGRNQVSGSYGDYKGFMNGGFSGSLYYSTLDSVSFASNSVAVSHGDLITAKHSTMGLQG